MAESKINFIVVGHVDHGKSTFCGHLLYLTGGIAEADFKKIEREADKDKQPKCKFSRILDVFDEEKERGKTHEFEKISFEYGDNKFVLIDTPGHKTFIRSMISGLYETNSEHIIGCLMVSISKGEFESGFGNGQTKEDVTLLRAVGIMNIIVLINKMDTVDWDEKVFSTYKAKLDIFIKKLRFQSVTYIPISGFKGTNMISKADAPTWYQGDCFIDTLVAVDKGINKEDKPIEPVHKTKAIKVQFNVLAPILVTSGYGGVMHYYGGEVKYEVERLLTINDKAIEKNVIGKKDDRLTVVLCLENVVNINKGAKLLYRDKELTIGFGKVISIKPVS